MSAHLAACRAAYRAGQGTYRLGGAPRDELCGVCSLPLGRDGYQVLETWFHRAGLLPVAEPEVEKRETVFGHVRIEVKLEVEQCGIEGIEERLRAAIKTALAALSVPGATAEVTLRNMAMQREQEPCAVLAVTL